MHQNHDYPPPAQGAAALPLAETKENIRLAGGKRAIFNLVDSDRTLVDGMIQRMRWDSKNSGGR